MKRMPWFLVLVLVGCNPEGVCISKPADLEYESCSGGTEKWDCQGDGKRWVAYDREVETSTDRIVASGSTCAKEGFTEGGKPYRRPK